MSMVRQAAKVTAVTGIAVNDIVTGGLVLLTL